MLKILPKVPLALLALLTVTLADTVVLKSGEKLEGKITAETETDLTIEIKDGGVIDERVLSKADVQSVQKEAADEAAWAALKNLKLGDNSLPADRYDSFLGPLRAFVSTHPQSKYKAEAEKLIAEFSAEQKRVADGERKLAGKWLTKEEVQQESYQINGAIAFNYLREQAARNDVTGALNTFDALEKQFPNSRGYLDAVEFVKPLLSRLKAQADARLAALPGEIAEQKKGLEMSTPAKRVEYQAELDRVKNADAAALEAAKRQQQKWLPFLGRSEAAMKEISALAASEAARLAALDLAKPRQAVTFAEQVRAALAKKDVEAADAALKKAKESWSNYEPLARLEKELDEARATLAAAPPAPAVPEVKAEAAPAEEKPAESAPVATVAVVEEEAPANPVFRIVLSIIIAAFAFAGWKAYSGIRKKANEVIE